MSDNRWEIDGLFIVWEGGALYPESHARDDARWHHLASNQLIPSPFELGCFLPPFGLRTSSVSLL